MEESRPLLRQSSIESDNDGSHNNDSSSRNVKNTVSSGGISNLVKLGYAFGHAQNDLCGAMYFSYLLVFLEGTGLSPSDAGNVLIAGQLVDGTCTPIVGYISDRWDGVHFNHHDHNHDGKNKCKYEGLVGREDHFWGLAGRRKTWYIGGLFLVTSTFWMLFTPIPMETSDTLSSSSSFIRSVLSAHPVICYAIANSLFQAGWASVQVSHMAMVPEMTTLLSERCFLNSIRYAVTVGTSITIYLLVYLFSPASNSSSSLSDSDSDSDFDFGSNHNKTANNNNDNTTNNDADLLLKLQKISYIVLLAGALMGLAFVVMVNETSKKNERTNNTEIFPPPTSVTAPQPTTSTNDDEIGTLYGGDPIDVSTRWQSIRCSNYCSDSHGKAQTPTPTPKTLGDWLWRTSGFAGVTANYALSRLCGNILQLYLPFFVLQAMPWDPAAVATVPLMAYVGMIASSIVAPRVSAVVKDAAWLCGGATVIIALGSALLLFGFDSNSNSNNPTNMYVVYLSSTILGFGCAQLMVTSQTQVGELVGNDANGGIVFGVASLCDKFSTGVVIYLVQRFVESLSSSSSTSSSSSVGDNNNDNHNDTGTVSLGDLYQYTAAGGPIICALLACLALWTVPMSIRDRDHHK